MSTSDNKNRPTSILVTGANILQALSPSRVGLLLVIYDNDTQTQKEISDAIGRTQSTVSTYLQSLGSLTPPLAARQGKYYAATKTGKKVVGLINDLARRCDCKLRSINWTDETERKDLETILTPLHDSQIMRPYLILDSLSTRSGIDGPIGTPQPVSFDDIVRDVESRYNNMGKSTTTEEIRRTVKLRFNDTGAVRFNEGEVILGDKGHQHACLWDELLQYLQKQEEMDSGEETAITDTETTTGDFDDFVTTSSTPSGSSSRTTIPSSASQQIVLGRPHSDKQFTTEQRDTSERPNVIPVYTLHPTTETDREWSDSSPIIPLSERMTIEELTASVNQLATEYNEETELVLEWMVQTDSGLYPLSSNDSSPSDTLELQNR